MNTTKMWLKSIVRYPLDIRRAKGMLAAQPRTAQSNHRGRAIVLEITSPQLQFDCARHLVCIARHAAMIASPVKLRCSGVLLGGIARKLYGKLLLTDPNVTWVSRNTPLPHDALVLTDADPPENEIVDGRDYLRLMVGRDVVPSAPIMPYPMHPETILHAQNLDLKRLRESADRQGAFFAGRQKASYGSDVIEANFGVMSRMQYLDTLQDAFPSRISNDLQSRDRRKPITLLNTAEQSIQASEWLPTLARFNYFLCPPGASQPICHNAIEAMCVGTIPILEYGNRFWPGLTDGVNAICFRGKTGLIDAIQRIEAMNPAQVEELRRGVVEYYERHLRGEIFLANLRDGKISSDNGMISMPFHDQNFFSEPRQPTQRRAA